VIGDYDLKDMIIVDNLVHSFGLQVDNGVPIVEYHDDPRDEELLYLQDYLRAASQEPDLRAFNRKNLGLARMIDLEFNQLIKDL
jgi:CTD small phosphatase-like protein 2